MAKSFWMSDQKGNFSDGGKDTFDETKDYIGIRLQQGVPLLDRDWNELEDIRRYQDWVLRDKYLGDGTPDNGFAISLIIGKVDDFNISKGRCLVDGFEAVNRTNTSYSKQTDVAPLTIPTGKRTDLVYIDLWISEIHGTDDLKNDQDVKIETCARHKVEWRVRVSEDDNKPVPGPLHHVYIIASIERDGGTITAIKDLRTALRINSLFKVISVGSQGNIGIRSENPSRPLTVRAVVASQELISFEDPTGKVKWHINQNLGGNNPGLNFAETGVADGRLFLKAGGNVGIGTASPVAKLHVAGDMNVDGRASISSLNIDPKGPGGIVFGPYGDKGGFTQLVIDISQRSGGYSRLQCIKSSGIEYGSLCLNPTAGNVGIGTTDPQSKLHVAGDLLVASGVVTINGGSLRLGANTPLRGKDMLLVMSFGPNVNLPNNDGSDYQMLHKSSGYFKRNTLAMHVHKDDAFGIYSTGWMPLLEVEGGTGNVYIKGNLGTHGFSPTPKTSQWGGGIHTWDVEAEGTVWSRNTVQTGARDLAENYKSSIELEEGDVVSLRDEVEGITHSDAPNDSKLIGIVSTQPGFLLNSVLNKDCSERYMYPIALSGRVPCKVTDEGGPIKRGDLLTSSSTPSHAMKAKPIKVGDQEIFRQGTIIGKALEPLESGKGLIDVFVFMM